MTPTRLIAGAMSGTSADGVDVAITRVAGRGYDMTAEMVLHHHRPYDPHLRQSIFAIRSGKPVELREIARVGREVSLTYAAAVTESLHAANLKPAALAAIAAHGQTLFHEVPLTIQYFDPSLVAYEVGCPVISDFRRADLAAGGQGAPLVPFADYILFRHPTKTRVLLNLGGIANITYLKAGGTPNDVIAFDIGPANCISDHICRTVANQSRDEGGRLSLEGTPNRHIVQDFDEDEFFHQRGPASTDTPAMIAAYERMVDRYPEERSRSVPDRLATACMISAYMFKNAISALPSFPDEVIAAGGGMRNAGMVHYLKQALRGDWHTPLQEHLQSTGRSQIDLLSTDGFGVPVDAKEALAFALLAAATLDNVPSNIPSVTGARRGVVLGSITPKP